MKRLWINPDGSVLVSTFPEGKFTTRLIAKTETELTKRGLLQVGYTFVDGEKSEIDSLLPADRVDRDSWRYRTGRVVVEKA